MSDVTAAAPDPMLNRTQLAQIFSVSENTIVKWLSKGMPVETEGGNGRAYEFSFSKCKAWFEETQAAADADRKAVEAFVAQQQMEFLGVDRRDETAGLSASKRRELAQAELVWMQAAEKRRSLVRVDDVVDLLDLIFTEVRAGLDGQPDWLEREFSLSGSNVERVITYNDGILKGIKVAIEAKAYGEDPGVIDPLDRGLF